MTNSTSYDAQFHQYLPAYLTWEEVTAMRPIILLLLGFAAFAAVLLPNAGSLIIC